MYKDAVEYKPGHYLAPGSNSLGLYKEKKWKELETLLKETDAAWGSWRGAREDARRTLLTTPSPKCRFYLLLRYYYLLDTPLKSVTIHPSQIRWHPQHLPY